MTAKLRAAGAPEQIDDDKTIDALVARARAAQQLFEGYSQEAVDEVVVAVAWAIMEPARNRELSEQAVADTGLGNVDDKIMKNHRKTLGLLRDLRNARSVGVVAEYPEKGLVEIARPVGVVGAIVPSTNPVATPMNKTLNALKGRNAILLAPSPKGQGVCARLLEHMHAELDRVGAPRDLIQQIPSPVSKSKTAALLQRVDLVVVTGSQNNVRAAATSGTPAIGVGAGNVPVIVDESADLADAVDKIMRSKTFDNATSCSSENSLVILDKVYDATLDALTRVGGELLTKDEKAQLENALWEHGHINREVIAKTATQIAKLASLDRPELADARFLMVEEQGVGPEHPLSGEKMSPILTIYRAGDFDAAFSRTREILDYLGAGHSCGIHTQDADHVMRLGLEMPVCRVIVNQAHCFANGGNFNNGLPFSLSMGCGTWGGNIIDSNMNYRHYLNTTRIAREIPPDEPSVEEIFGEYHAKYGLA